MSTGWAWLAALAAALGLALALPGNATALPYDFELDSDEWNGLARLNELALDQGIILRHVERLDYAQLSPDRPLLLLAPEQGLQAADLQSFIAHGGRVLLALENDAADELLLGLSEPIEPLGEPPADAASQSLNANPKLPLIPSPGRHPLLDGNVRSLAANHPVAFVSTLPPVVAFERWELGFVYDLSLGEGKLILVGDASLFINLMLPFADNRRFALNALGYLCGGRLPCTLDVYSGRFEQIAQFSPGPAPPTPLDKLHRVFGVFNQIAQRWAQWTPDARLLRVMTFMLCLGLLLLGLTIFPMQSPSFLGLRLRPPDERQAQSEFARNVAELSKRSKANYNLPLALLRDDFEPRLFSVLYSHDAPAPEQRYSASAIAESARRYAMRVAKSEGEKRQRQSQLQALLRELGELPMQSHLLILQSKQWTRADLMRLYAQSREVLSALGLVAPEPGARNRANTKEPNA